MWASSLVGLRDPAVNSPRRALPLRCVRRTGNQKRRQTLTEQVSLYRSGKGTLEFWKRRRQPWEQLKRMFQKEKKPALCRGLNKKVTVSVVRQGWDEAEKWSRSWYRAFMVKSHFQRAAGKLWQVLSQGSDFWFALTYVFFFFFLMDFSVCCEENGLHGPKNSVKRWVRKLLKHSR